VPLKATKEAFGIENLRKKSWTRIVTVARTGVYASLRHLSSMLPGSAMKLLALSTPADNCHH
jgi:hypothetical protein